MKRKILYSLLAIYAKKKTATENTLLLRSIPPFSDNAYAVYYYYKMHLSSEDIKVYWVATKDEEFRYYIKHNIPVLNLRAIEGIKKFFKAKVVADTGGIFSMTITRPIIKSKNQRWIFMWHGIPIKVKPERDLNMLLNITSIVNRQYDIGISTSKFSSVLLAVYTGMNYIKFVVTGYPRNDLMFWRETREKGARFLESKFPNILSFSGRILYTPTWRKRRAGNLIDLGSAIHHDYEKLRRINDMLERHGICLILKLHPFEEELISRRLYEKIRDNLKNIILLRTKDLLDNEITIYHILPHVDMLITDYSSIAIDFLLLDKPIVFLRDKNSLLETYLDDAFNFGVIIEDPMELIENIDEIFDEKDIIRNQQFAKRIYHKYTDGLSSRRLWRIIKHYFYT